MIASKEKHIVCVLPARWNSSRFPGKPLHLIAGKPMIQHVWERCRECKQIDDVYVATDDSRIYDAVIGFGGKAIMTSEQHQCGTERIAETLQHIPAATHIINVQGDEPFISTELIDELALTIVKESKVSMVTAANPICPSDPAVNDQNVVKVVTTLNGRALYFSRSPLPFFRNAVLGLPVLRHKGVYAYRRNLLERFKNWPLSPLEQAESLEQLRVLEHGMTIQVVITDDVSSGIDTPEQAEKAELDLAAAVC